MHKNVVENDAAQNCEFGALNGLVIVSPLSRPIWLLTKSLMSRVPSLQSFSSFGLDFTENSKHQSYCIDVEGTNVSEFKANFALECEIRTPQIPLRTVFAVFCVCRGRHFIFYHMYVYLLDCLQFV